MRPDHIEDILTQLHPGQWFGWSDSADKSYANLVILDPQYSKPLEQELTDALAAAQAEYDDYHAPYRKSRRAAYTSVSDQLDMLWHDMEDGTTKWHDLIRSIKLAHPKA